MSLKTILRRCIQFPSGRGGLVICSLFSAALALAGFSWANAPSTLKPLTEKPAQPSTLTSNFEPTDRQTRIAEEILRKLLRRHYEKRQLNDLMSSSLLDSYLEKLDPSRVYFTREDIRNFEPLRFQLDDEIRRGNLDPGFEIFNAYHTRMVSHLTALVDTLPERIRALDFTLDESITTDPETLPWANSIEELEDRRRKNLKNTVLGMKLDQGFQDKLDSLINGASEQALEMTVEDTVNNTDVERVYIAALPVTLQSGSMNEEDKNTVHEALRTLLVDTLVRHLKEPVAAGEVAGEVHDIVTSRLRNAPVTNGLTSQALTNSIDDLLQAPLLQRTSTENIEANLDNALQDLLQDQAGERQRNAFNTALAGEHGHTFKRHLISQLSLRLAGADTADLQETAEALAINAFKTAVLNEYIVLTLDDRYRDQLKQFAELNSDDVFNLFINTLAELFDPHTSYLAPKVSENFSIQMRLSLDGIGALLRRDGEYTVVQRLVTGGPAEIQGALKAGDRILGVGQGANGDIVNVIGWRLDEVVEKIRGKKGSTVRLKVLPQNAPDSSSESVIQIVRNTVKLEEQAASKEIRELNYQGETRKIGVITIPTFYIDFEGNRRGDENYRSTTRDVTRLVRELQQEQVEGFVIDLRGNGGGSLQEVSQLLRLFIESGPVVQIRYSNGRIDPDGDYPNPDYVREPVVVLIDRLSASASEIFAGAIQDYDRGVIVGSQSFGKGTVQQLAELSHGALKLTQAKFYRVSGESTQHRGVIPDVVMPSPYDSQDIGENTLENALNWDRIAGRHHRNYGDIEALKYQLVERHKQRIANNYEFRYLQDRIALSEQYSEIKQWSLNEKKRRDFIEQDRQQREMIEQSYEAARELAADIDMQEFFEPEPDNRGSKAIDETDFLLTEAGYILLDSISLQKDLDNNNPLAANQPH